MATMCPACKGEISDDAKACMHCGSRLDRLYPNGAKKAAPWLLPLILALAFVVMLGLWWNMNRLENERSNRNVCDLAATC